MSRAKRAFVRSGRRLIIILAGVGLGEVATSVYAAAILPDPVSSACSLRLEGLIEKGDAATFKMLLDQQGDRRSLTLCLSSAGGSFNEALALIEVIRQRGRPLRTIVERDRECLSACALIFMAGRGPGSTYMPDRRIHAGAHLGFHAPFIKPGAPSYDAAVVERAHREALRALARFLVVYDRKAFPDSLLIKMLTKTPAEFLYASTIDNVGEWRIGLFGYKEPSISPATLKQACDNQANWNWGSVGGETHPPASFRLTHDLEIRRIIPNYGDEAAAICIADLYLDSKKGSFLDVNLADTPQDSDVPKEGSLRAKAKMATSLDDRPGKPLWYGFAPNTKLETIKLP